MATSPLLLLGWLALTGRFSGGVEFPTRPDPPGFANALRAYIPFVLAVRRLPDTYSSKDELQLESALELADAQFPQILPTRLEDNFRDDLLRPILDSQRKVVAWVREKHSQLLLANRFDEATVTLVKGIRLTLMLNLGDSGDHSRSTTIATSFLEQIDSSVSKCKPETQAWIASELKKQESRRPDIIRCFKNDVNLLTIAAATKSNNVSMDEAKWAAQALEEVSKGKPIDDILRRLRKWSPGPEASRMWDIVCGWNLMIKNEENLRRKKAQIFAQLGSTPPPILANRFIAGRTQLASSTLRSIR